MMSKLVFKPKELRESVKSEGMRHKARILGFSCITILVSTAYLQYFQNLVYRSGQMQDRALASKEHFNNIRDGHDMITFMIKNAKDLLETKSLKELKYIQEGWKDRTWTPPNQTNAVAAGP